MTEIFVRFSKGGSISGSLWRCMNVGVICSLFFVDLKKSKDSCNTEFETVGSK